ncbi:GPR endopeptidase [Clostridium hydrogenum]|uniref:GPR endopeptidase n=1 Tax=Clostridium hydrogenum TaxID=2855764 RepID=UPI001F1739D0|nr:GPR endopeptidase [Clostridium hydrogenum]
MFNVRTDLAIEAKEIYSKQSKNDTIEGVIVSNKEDEEIKITRVDIKDEKGERALNKPRGTYITLDIPKLTNYDPEDVERVSRILSKEVGEVIKNIKLDESMTTLVVGLGNWNITPDALGPKVISKLMITRHLKQYIPDSIDEGIRPVCGVAPGVLGITGIETGEIIKGIVEKIKPNLIICIDALASRKMERVNATIQIGNTGISPGSGVGNKRMEISERTLGVPVIALGVPTVVDAATMASDTIDLVIDEMIKESTSGSKFYNMLKTIDKGEKEKMIHELLDPYIGNLMVTPKEVDMIIDTLSNIIATALNIALQPELELKEISKYIS